MKESVQQNGQKETASKEVTAVIYQAPIDRSSKFRYSVGKSRQLIQLRKFLPLPLYQLLIGNVMAG
ncbi:hypothetical protein [Enterococcus sp. LJL51]|uniref:hypothetical protein n=1 Tax=Enterococcus sp. LJL51 TaxID=3416656 RepID=UPI003CEAA650